MPDAPDDHVALVLAGGGARGAYEIGALSILLPLLEERGQRPRIVVGTSVGALNAAYLAANAHRTPAELVDGALEVWRTMGWDDVVESLASPGAIGRIAEYAGEVVGFPGARLDSMLDPAPLRDTVLRLMDFDQLERNAAGEELHAAAVVATSALTSRSVVFHRGGQPRASDPHRGIDYVETVLGDEHVRASAAIPGVFPAVHVAAPARARGWYFDGGTRLNTPIKPALELGASRVVVIALNSLAVGPRELAGEEQPDALEGAGQLLQAVLVDPLAHDIQSLASVNRLVAGGDGPAGKARRVPYIAVAPERRDSIGARAAAVFREHYMGVRDALGAPDLAILGRAVGGGADPRHGELLSYLFFAPEFAASLIELGQADARRWLAQSHDEDNLWQVGPIEAAG